MNINIKLSFINKLSELPDFIKTLRYQLLPAKSRLNRHDKNHLNLLKIRKDCFNGSSRLNCYAGSFTIFMYLVYNRVGIIGGLQMKCYGVCPNVHKVFYVTNRVNYHQMHIKKLIGYPSYALNYRHSIRNRRNKHSIHDINMYVVGASFIDFFDLRSQSCKIS